MTSSGKARRSKADPIGPDWEPPIPVRRHVLRDWHDYMELARRIVGRFHDLFTLRHFNYLHPAHLQPNIPGRHKKPYAVRVAYTEWGDAANPTLVS